MISAKKKKAKRALLQPDKKKGRWGSCWASANGRVIEAIY
jgi:hypothetical protein